MRSLKARLTKTKRPWESLIQKRTSGRAWKRPRAICPGRRVLRKDSKSSGLDDAEGFDC
jgi:hypothetical protein